LSGIRERDALFVGEGVQRSSGDQKTTYMDKQWSEGGGETVVDCRRGNCGVARIRTTEGASGEGKKERKGPFVNRLKRETGEGFLASSRR